MNISQMITRLRLFIEDPGPGTGVSWEENDLKEMLNQAYEMIVTYLDSVDYYHNYLTTTITMAPQTKAYSLPAVGTWRKILKLVDEDEYVEYDIIDPRQWPIIEYNQRARKCWIDTANNQLRLFEDPWDTNIYTLYYIGKLESLDFAGAVAIPDLYHSLIPLKAATLILSSERDTAARTEFDRQYTEMLQKLVETVRPHDLGYVRDVGN